MARKFRIPKYRKHSSGQARVTLDQKDHLLGPYNSPENHQTYKRLITEWLERKGEFDSSNKPNSEPLSINELLLSYWQFAECFYGFDDPQPTAKQIPYARCLECSQRIVRFILGQ